MRWLPGVDDEATSPLPRIDSGAPEHLIDPEEPVGYPEPPLPVAWALPASMAFLRRTGAELRRLPLEVRIAGICRVARSWLDVDDETRGSALELLPEESGLSPEMVAWGLDRAFEVVTPEALRGWWAREGSPARPDGPGLSGHVLAGNVFSAGIPPIIASILAGVPAVVKAPATQPTFAALFARSFALHAPELGPTVAAAAWPRTDERATAGLLAGSDVVFAFGDDASIAALRALRPDVHGFGHRYSIAVIAEPSANDGLIRDALAWDGAGCLTPRWVFVDGDPEVAARAAANRIEAIVNELPARPLSAAAGAGRSSWLAQAAFAGWSVHGPGWGVASLPEARLQPAPPARVMCFLPLPEPAALLELLRPLGPRLQAVAVLGPEERRARIAHDLAPLGVSRVCGPGELQRPPIDWNHDDVRILAALV